MHRGAWMLATMYQQQIVTQRGGMGQELLHVRIPALWVVVLILNAGEVGDLHYVPVRSKDKSAIVAWCVRRRSCDSAYATTAHPHMSTESLVDRASRHA